MLWAIWNSHLLIQVVIRTGLTLDLLQISQLYNCVSLPYHGEESVVNHYDHQKSLLKLCGFVAFRHIWQDSNKVTIGKILNVAPNILVRV